MPHEIRGRDRVYQVIQSPNIIFKNIIIINHIL